jgi:hypothetical protein
VHQEAVGVGARILTDRRPPSQRCNTDFTLAAGGEPAMTTYLKWAGRQGLRW